MQDLPTPFPLPLDQYMDPSGAGVIAILLSRVQQQPINGLATAIFLLAVFHTFVANRFRRAAQRTQLEFNEARRQRVRSCPSGEQPCSEIRIRRAQVLEKQRVQPQQAVPAIQISEGEPVGEVHLS